MNSERLDASVKYKECAGKGCQNVGIHYLKIIYLNKSGWFCDACKTSLMADNLAVQEKVE